MAYRGGGGYGRNYNPAFVDQGEDPLAAAIHSALGGYQMVRGIKQENADRAIDAQERARRQTLEDQDRAHRSDVFEYGQQRDALGDQERADERKDRFLQRADDRGVSFTGNANAPFLKTGPTKGERELADQVGRALALKEANASFDDRRRHTDATGAARAHGLTVTPDMSAAQLEELVEIARTGRRRTESQPRLAETPRGILKDKIGTLDRQIDDTRQELGGAQRAVPSLSRYSSTPADSAAARSATGEVGRFRGRLDSLTNVRDSLAGEYVGTTGGRSGGPRTASVQSPDGLDAELKQADTRRQRLLQAGADSAEVDRAYQALVQQIRRRRGG